MILMAPDGLLGVSVQRRIERCNSPMTAIHPMNRVREGLQDNRRMITGSKTPVGVSLGSATE